MSVEKVIQYTNIFCTTSVEWILYVKLSSPVAQLLFFFDRFPFNKMNVTQQRDFVRGTNLFN